MNRKSALTKAGWMLLIVFSLMNVVAFMHAYNFTHFSDRVSERTKDPAELSTFEKIRIVATGIDNPKPKIKAFPNQPYKTVFIDSGKQLACWHLTVPESKGTIILFHGYAGEKSSLLLRSEEFRKLGFNTLLVDFIGSGESEGNHTTIGFHEAAQVKACFEFVKAFGEQKIYLFGTSMGAVAILKSIHDYKLPAEGIMLECPFGSLYKTVCARFEILNLPSFPMAGLLTFWGGIQHGYWAFFHNPSLYAKSVTCPVLLLFGELDNRVSRQEIDAIFSNVRGHKMLKTYPEEGHDIFSPSNRNQWSKDVTEFINDTEVKSQS